MLNLKEIGVIVFSALLLGLIVSVVETWQKFYYITIIVLVIIMVNVLAKKVISYYLDSEVEIKPWNIERWWFKSHHRFKKPVPAGIFVPIILKILSLGYFNWFATMAFEVKAKTYRAAQRFGLYTFSEVSEFHIGLIAAAGVIANLALAVLGYLINVPDLARLSIYYAFFNMIPISELDGTKIFFGSVLIWSILAAITAIATFMALLVI
mgnify:CR=1 FL=1